ncbi:hypothetical protein FHS21_000318 [Phyllobacterium trifolii]|uniref:Uncharacterized protein n=1 Tax=Phyllobacterium trifolii TaxID=300193 RepID=A0A839U1L8_9HYPH|nr:hypothetical protein [Phyllobacterium trifolii]MBB3143935.1 hypothetical protein [Phyllobacterium trifolii]
MERPETEHIDQDANLDALANFVDYSGINRDRGGRCRFDADILFSSDRTVDERTRVHISFRDDDVSVVRFTEKGELNPVNVHTEFRLASSVFRFEDEELQIFGSSPKVGQYKVRIRPL